MKSESNDHFDFNINGDVVRISPKELHEVELLGEGSFGLVYKMKYVDSDYIFAVKVISIIYDDYSEDQILKECNIIKGSELCPFIINCYGIIYTSGEIWICMETMDTSLDKFYKNVPAEEFIAEQFLVYIIFSMVSGLRYIYKEMNVIHRDVKPSNVLIDRKGRVQICDFGVSGFLVNSIAKTNTGTLIYLAPERLDTKLCNNNFDIRSDVWSLGLTVLEVATKKFPYRKWNSRIEQIRDVLNNNPPTLPNDAIYSNNLQDFISKCLVKDRSLRARYDELLEHGLLMPLKDDDLFNDTQSKFVEYVSEVL